MSLERDLSLNLKSQVEFILSPSHINSEIVQNLFDGIIDELLRLDHQIEASLPDLSQLPPPNNQSSIENLEQVSYLCHSTAYRTEQCLRRGYLPITLSEDESSSIGSIIAAFKTEREIFVGQSTALFWINDSLSLGNLSDNTKPLKIEENILSLLLNPELSVNPLFETLSIFINSISQSHFEPITPNVVINVGLSENSSIKPNFHYYSIDIIQECGLSEVLKEIEKTLSRFEKVYVSWNIGSIGNRFGLTEREGLQLANWIDLKLRKNNKLLGIDLNGCGQAKQEEDLLKLILLRVLGDSYFN